MVPLQWSCFGMALVMSTAGSSSVAAEPATAPGAAVAKNTSSLRCVAKKFPCAQLGYNCSRPAGIFVYKMRGSGLKMFGEGVLNHIFERENLFVAEGWSLAHGPTFQKLAAARESGWLTTIVLRDPLERAMSRYWFEGRWPLFQKAEPDKAHPFKLWLQRDHCGMGRRGPRLWDCSENYYVKSLAGWQGEAMCHGTESEGCVGGVGPLQTEKAKHVLQGFDLILITEWLDTPASIAALGQHLCFNNTNGVPPIVKGLSGQKRAVPDFSPKRPAGGHAGSRPGDWVPDAEDMDFLRRANALDVDLYGWAKHEARMKLIRDQPHLAKFLQFPPI